MRVLATLGVGGQEMAKSWEKYRGHTIRNDWLSDDWSIFQAVYAHWHPASAEDRWARMPDIVSDE